MNYICDNYDEIECELNGDAYEESKKHNYNFCVSCNKEMLFNYSMKPLRRKWIYKRSDNFKAILNQFFNGEKQLVPDDVMKAIRNETNNKTNILYNYEIPVMIPILECILKRNKMTKYKDGICYIFLK